MREGGLRRGSPGYRSRSSSRSRSRSPWSRSRSPRSRSRSPYRRPGSRSPPGGYRSRSPARRYSRSRSRSPSRSPRRQRGASPARSNSSHESGQIRDKSRSRSRRDRARAQAAPPQHQQQAVGRLGQDSTQLRALRQQLEQEQLARAAAESKAELLRNKLREVAERSKARGNTLASVVSAVRRVADAKQQLSSAEADLQQALQDAEVFLQDEGAAAPIPAQHAAPAPPEQIHHQQSPQHEHAAANGADVRMQESPAEDAGGGWVQASIDNAAPVRQQPPLSNIKFSLKL